jgi:hypothetical protein
MLTITEVFLIGAATVVALLGIAELIARLAHYSFLVTIILGQDNRTSTSKTFVFMWTLLVGWALTCLLIAGELIKAHACAAIPDINTAITACTLQHDRIGLLQAGWRQFLGIGLVGGYLVLLGVAAAAAVAAKGITQAKDQSGAVPKTTVPSGQKQSLAIRVAQVFTLTGTGLTADRNARSQSLASADPKIQINGQEIPGVKADPTFAGQLTGTLPPDLIPEGTQTRWQPPSRC